MNWVWIKRGAAAVGLPLSVAATLFTGGVANADPAPAGCTGTGCPGVAPAQIAGQQYQAPLQGGFQHAKGQLIGQALGFIQQTYPTNGFCYTAPSMISPSVQGTIMTNAKGHQFVSPLWGGAAAYDDGC